MNKKTWIILILSALDAIAVALGHNFYLTPVVIVGLLLFIGIIAVNDIKLILPLMLFFLPWATIMKVNPGTFSFFSLVSILILTRLVIKSRKLNNLNAMVAGLLLIAMIVLTSVARAEAIPTAFIRFSMVLLMLTWYISDKDNYPDFEVCTLFYSAGMLLASGTAYLLLASPGMQRFINITNYANLKVTRLAGFNPDPNYFAMQVLLAVVCLFVLSNHTRSNLIKMLQFAAIGCLLFFGFTTVSKMFLISLIMIGLVWFIGMLTSRNDFSQKATVILLVAALLTVIVSTQMFSDMIDEYLKRFAQVTNVSSLTTGRSDLQTFYIKYIFKNIDVLLCGVGFGLKYPVGALNNVHNTPIDFIYRMGVIGTILFITWFLSIFKQASLKVKMLFEKKLQFLIVLLGLFMPWMALDVLGGDEFFYYLTLLIFAYNYLKIQQNNELASIPGNTSRRKPVKD
ncbi:MAG: hypothetical protein ABFD08_15820 [Syntrophomonas sp.]